MSQAVPPVAGARSGDSSWGSCPWAILRLQEEDGQSAPSPARWRTDAVHGCLAGERRHHHRVESAQRWLLRSRPSPITRFPSFLAGTAVHLRFRCLLEVWKGFLPLNEKSNKKCCPVQSGLGFPASFMWHGEFTRANLALRSKKLICLFLLWTGSCS